ncbi:MAG: hypothetical protein H7Z75_09395 [Ferruginibacter sp.]|nr:hypothetical protein [Cytophagales bacterium]
MAEVKGISIMVCGDLMSPDQKHIQKANQYLQILTGKASYKELHPSEWYDVRVYEYFMDTFAEASVTGEYALVILGKRIYPRLNKLGVLPKSLTTPLDFIQYEAQGFLDNHRGAGVVPRRFIKATAGEVIVHAPAPGYNSKLYEGIYLGILDVCGVKTGKVKITAKDTFHISW